jgi:cephalosporin-C deacetylase-like acetyl esterase
MKKLLFCFLILALKLNLLSAQNFLPFEWRISFSDTAQTSQVKRIDSWKTVNLLLSWERQGYFSRQGKCCLATDFMVSGSFADSTLILSVGLQCNVAAIYINNHYIGGKLPCLFWSDKNAKTEFRIPSKILNKQKKNRIEIYASDLSYTGGLSYNSCKLLPCSKLEQSNVKVIVPIANHVIVDKGIKLKLRFKTSENAKLCLSIKNDFHKQIVYQQFDVTSRDSVVNVDLSNEIKTPGFYECVAYLNGGGYSGDVQWVALSPEKLNCTTDTIAGYKQYWDDMLAELNAVKPDFKIHKVDSLTSATRDGYVVEMRSLGNLIVRGYYFVPRTAGKHAAILHVPGYGWGFQNVSSFINSEENVIELALCVRGHGISADVFNPGFDIPGIWGYQLCSERDNAYRAIYADCVRAVEFLLSRAEVDSLRIGVMGGSQGGGLTLATAGLCKNKIAACAYFDPFQCDIHDFVNIREICKTELTLYHAYYNNACSLEQVMHVQDLINTKGFANWITCPTLFATSLFDDDCPPHVGFAAYNAIKSPKQYVVYPNDSHFGESNYTQTFIQFFKKQLDF